MQGIGTSIYLADLKSDVDKLSNDKLKNVPANLNNLKSRYIRC